REFPLQRADATEVVEALIDLLDLQSSDTAGGGATPSAPSVQQISQTGQGSVQAQVSSPPPNTSGLTPKIRADVRTNKVIAVALEKDMDYIATLIEFLDAPSPQRTLYTRQLNYIRVATLLSNLPNALLPGRESPSGTGSITGGELAESNADTLGSTSTGGSSSSSGLGSFDFGDDIGPQSLVIDKTFVMADNVQNRILATGPEEHLEIIDVLIDELDREPKQIQISAIIAQLTLGDDQEFGLDLLREASDPTETNFAGSLRNRSGSILDVDTLLGVTDFTPLGAGLTIYGKIEDRLNAYLSALSSSNRFEVLSRPTVYTRNDRAAVISNGQRIAVPSSTLSTVDPGNVNQAISSSISFEEVVLRIEVLPLINSDDQITLNILQVNDNIVGSQNISGNDIPTIGTQSLATTVVLPDGGTVLLGGLISEDDNRTESGIPKFVSLPLVGPLFGNTRNEKNRQELLVFIQPKIIDSPRALLEAQSDVQARSSLSTSAMEFAAPKIRAESKPASERNLMKKLF
ncbi:MAG: secretin N-terminal domain-containing protein, partial [Verrucomicrobiota bacterium]